MANILARAEHAGAKMVLVGDYRQLQPIAAGGAFRLLTEHLPTPRLTQIVRQVDPWQRNAVRQIAEGETLAALGAFAAHGRFHIEPDRPQAQARLIDAWWQQRQQKPDARLLIVGQTRAEVKALNDAVRLKLRAAGALGEEVTIPTEHGPRPVAIGETLLFLKNNALYGVRNGTLATLVGMRTTLGRVRALDIVDQDDGKRATVDLSAYHQIDYGYALTTHKAQGATVDHSFLLVGGALTDRELSYVQASRHRFSASLYFDQESAAELLREVAPTEPMIRYTEALARQTGKPLPEDYRHDFLACRDYLNQHSPRTIATESDALTALAIRMAISHQKDTVLDYAPARALTMGRR